ncbi:YdaU family protein [Nevskia soli]|uniref:YdaU family protein n=1 Tax=Nevskia soli TaxID=418856 RepID=UPI0006915A99|nr:YdaU family protein [Nevskia soli]
MNYYPHNIGDYAAATRGLSLAEHGAYRTMLDLYYLDEQPLPAAPEALCRAVGARGEEERAAVLIVALNYFEERDGLLYHRRCEAEIAHYQSNVERCRNNGKKGGRPRMFGGDVPRETKPTPNPGLTQGKPNPNPTLTQGLAKQEPITNNQEKEKTFCTPAAAKKGSGSQARVITPAGARTPAVGGFPDGSPQPAAAQAVNNSGEAPPGDAPGEAGGSSPDAPTPTKPASVLENEIVKGPKDEPPEKPVRRTYLPKDFAISEHVRDWAQRRGHDRLEHRFEYFTSYAVRCAARYADWDVAFMASIRDDWAKLNPPPTAPVSYLGEGDIL